MKLLVLVLLLLIPIAGCMLIYRAYRIRYKNDYSVIKDIWGNVPEYPESLASSIAVAHFIAGLLTIGALFFITRVSLVDIAKALGAVGLLLRGYIHVLAKD